MNRKISFQIIKFFIAISAMSTLTLFMLFYHGLKNGLLLTFLFWSFFVLCIPGKHGSMLIGAPLQMFFKIRVNTQIWTWLSAVVLNLIVYHTNKDIYLENFITHLLRYIITSPYPELLVVVFAMAANLYKPIIGYNYQSKFYFLHAAIHTILVIVNLLALFWWIYPEAVFLFNFSMS